MASRGRIARHPRGAVALRRRRQRWWGAGAIALLILCMAGVWLASRALSSADGGQAAPTATPDMVIAQPTPVPPAMVEAAERQSLPSAGGAPISVWSYRGHPVVLAFYAEAT